jgi:S-adenosylmethionine uptake transporter
MRASVTSGMAFTFFWGIVRTPMAVGMALSFIAPIIALFMAGLALGEAITARAGGLGTRAGRGGRDRAGRMQGGGALEREAMLGMGGVGVGGALCRQSGDAAASGANGAPGRDRLFQSLFTAFFLSLAALVVGFPLYRWGQSGWIFRRRRRFPSYHYWPCHGVGRGRRRIACCPSNIRPFCGPH